jgi:hypothetical protein
MATVSLFYAIHTQVCSLECSTIYGMRTYVNCNVPPYGRTVAGEAVRGYGACGHVDCHVIPHQVTRSRSLKVPAPFPNALFLSSHITAYKLGMPVRRVTIWPFNCEMCEVAR